MNQAHHLKSQQRWTWMQNPRHQGESIWFKSLLTIRRSARIATRRDRVCVADNNNNATVITLATETAIATIEVINASYGGKHGINNGEELITWTHWFQLAKRVTCELYIWGNQTRHIVLLICSAYVLNAQDK